MCKTEHIIINVSLCRQLAESSNVYMYMIYSSVIFALKELSLLLFLRRRRSRRRFLFVFKNEYLQTHIYMCALVLIDFVHCCCCCLLILINISFALFSLFFSEPF